MRNWIKFCLISWVLQSATALAYIPEYSTILSRAASQHGKGLYKIEQEITLRKDNESYLLKETWTVQSENAMRVSIEGLGFLKCAAAGVQIYEGSQRQFIDPSGALRSQRLSDDFLHSFLVFRSSKFARNRLISMKIAPADSANDRPPLNIDGEPKYSPPSFLRLSRVGGSICYAVGAAPLPTPTTQPTAWIEQDQFVFRKIRTSTDAVWRADGYAKYGDFWYPKTQTYTWGPYQVTIQTTSVQPLTKSPQAEALLKSKSLVPARDALRLPEADVLRDFYSRFR